MANITPPLLTPFEAPPMKQPKDGDVQSYLSVWKSQKDKEAFEHEQRQKQQQAQAQQLQQMHEVIDSVRVGNNKPMTLPPEVGVTDGRPEVVEYDIPEQDQLDAVFKGVDTTLAEQQKDKVASDEEEYLNLQGQILDAENDMNSRQEESIMESEEDEPTQQGENPLKDVLGERESSNRYDAVNQLGYLGKYQFGGMALRDLGYKDKNYNWTGKDGINSKEEFLASEDVQEKAMDKYIDVQWKYLKNKGTDKFVGETFKGETVTKEGLIAAAHLVGAGAVNKMLKTGEVPQDANGTKAMEYLIMGNSISNGSPKNTNVNIGDKYSDKVKNPELKKLFNKGKPADLYAYIDKKGWSRSGVVGSLVKEFEDELSES